MNFKHSRTSMAIALLAVSLISMTSIQQDAFATTQGMSMTATAASGSDTITIEGQTASRITDVTFRVTSPSGNNVVAVAQVSPETDGAFSTEFKVGPTWSEDGFYTISAMQSIGGNSLYSLKVLVEVTNGMTEETSVTQSNLTNDNEKPVVSNNVTRDAGIQINAEAEQGSDTIVINGSTDRISMDVTITVHAPNGNVVSIDQVSPMSDGEFTSTITVGGPLWSQDGIYTVTAQQFKDSKYTASTEVEIKDGRVVPEFGAIAAMILAVAIISIIAVSARSKLSIMPRY